MTAPVDRPNILMICTDEQRGDYLGCMGHPHVKTPNLDRIAAEGTLFRNCYSNSPICMPARAIMLTGMMARTTGVVDNGISLDTRFPTLPGLLAESGYRTHSIGKLHLRNWGKVDPDDDEEAAINPERRMYWDWPNHWEGTRYKTFPDNYFGFQTIELCNGHVNYVYGDYVTWLEENHPGTYGPGYKCSNADPHPLAIDPDLHYNTWIADRTVEFVKNHVDSDRLQSTAFDCNRDSLPTTDYKTQVTDHTPFFLWCSFPDPHEPFAAVKKWSDFYEDVEIELSQNVLELSPHSRSETMTRAGLGTEVLDPEQVKESIRQTYGMVSHVDEQIGRILDSLEKTGMAENTVIMFVSDHGDQLGEHGLFYKSVYPYNAHAHVPFVAKVPGGVKGHVVDDVVSLVDVVPTALDLAGVEHPWDHHRDDGQIDFALPGESLRPVLEKGVMPQHKQALIEIDRLNRQNGILQMRTLVANDFKLVFYPVLKEAMLFDRKNDPHELTNLADDPEYQDVLTGMYRDLLAETARSEMPSQSMRLLGK